jgi:hypothetical protein
MNLVTQLRRSVFDKYVDVRRSSGLEIGPLPGVKVDCVERRKVMGQRSEIDALLVTELSRWGRSMLDLLYTQNGLAFDLSTPHGRTMAAIIACIADFERELIQERLRAGIAVSRWHSARRRPHTDTTEVPGVSVSSTDRTHNAGTDWPVCDMAPRFVRRIINREPSSH